MATHDFQWTGSWCSSVKVESDEDRGYHQTQRLHIAQGHHQAIFPLGSTASMDEYQLTVLGDFIQCWQTFVQFATRTQENGCNSALRRRCAQLNATEIRPPATSTLEMTNPAMLHHASEVMHFVSIGVTGLFIAFTVLKIVCLGRKFFSNIYEVTDALVILVSFVSDISYIKLDSQEISAMVILLLWRIVRLINGRWMFVWAQVVDRTPICALFARMCEGGTDFKADPDQNYFLINFVRRIGDAVGKNKSNCTPFFRIFS
ncbi:unnamed protein product [Hydatigera taeniaeformis]|uniref:Voltage-gated hydrogen channel 1 n=1 Tax=Hydatigena taeniaeformis TaxID=6205 RepID=A0A0R3WQF6_HYDTA|nr:unnamed protein product [Hydatigera taeniaeformis]